MHFANQAYKKLFINFLRLYELAIKKKFIAINEHFISKIELSRFYMQFKKKENYKK